MEGNLFDLIKNIFKKPTADTILNGKKLEDFPVRSGTEQGCLLTIPFQRCTGSPNQYNKTRK